VVLKWLDLASGDRRRVPINLYTKPDISHTTRVNPIWPVVPTLRTDFALMSTLHAAHSQRAVRAL
jgi:Cft2 family RNA processing exonuclease